MIMIYFQINKDKKGENEHRNSLHILHIIDP